MRRLSGLVPPRGDRWLAGCLVALSQVEVWRYGVAGGSTAAAATLGAAGLVVAWRTRFPVWTAVLVAASLTACGSFAGEPVSATSVAAMTVSFFSVGAMANRRRSVSTLVGAMLLGLMMTQPLSINDYLAITLTSFVVPWLVGLLWLRHRSAATDEREQAMNTQRAVEAERLKLARDLHDVVSHNVGMIAVQAGAADVFLDKDPAATRESLRAIEGGARNTLLELRRLLGLLRDGDPEPQTHGLSLADLDSVVDAADQAGIRVELSAEGRPARLGSTVEVTAYRIIQEALTNVVAHAGPCRVEVVLRYDDDVLDLDITDDGAGREGTSHGRFGLLGLQERAALLGGSLDAGPRSGGGFRVHAVLPLEVP
jgi:signal transduction histidine kinase